MSKKPVMSKPSSTPASPSVQAIPMSEFLETSPPNSEKAIADVFLLEIVNHNYRPAVRTPDIIIHCSSEGCNGARTFRITGDPVAINDPSSGWQPVYLRYLCSNCRKSTKLFCISVWSPRTLNIEFGKFYAGLAVKIGEQPIFGPHTPTRLLKILGDQRDHFLKGRRCENQGLGIGAFSYYRRVVEHQKDRILDEIIKVSTKVNTPSATIEALQTAKAETQFLKAMTLVKDAIPQLLLIDGHNPLTLLHAALSRGLHAQTDEDCLELAHDIRIVLAELAERLAQALKDEAELNASLARLMRRP